MNSERRQFWGGYLRDLCDRMGLRDWTPVVFEDHADDGYGAQVQCTYGRKRFKVRFACGFDHLDPEEQRETCVHELLHAHWGAMDQVIYDTRQSQNKDWMHRLADTIHLHHEYGIDAVANVLSPFMPLPPIEKPTKRKKKAETT